MSPAEVPPIGERVREERTRQAMSVRGLAREVGVSASMISQIETGKSQPSVNTLYAITTVLGISIEELFAPRPQPRDNREPVIGSDAAAVGTAGVVAGAGVQAGSAAHPWSEPEPGRTQGPVVLPHQRPMLELESGVTWERLGQLRDTHVDFLLITYQPGGASSTSGLLMRHPGREYGYVTSGELTLTLGFEEHCLRAGDSVAFDSTTPHRYRNDGDEPAVGVWFVLER